MAGKYSQGRPNIPEPIRREVMTEAGHKCSVRHCTGFYVDIHHINENREDNRPANLIVLCTEHHRMAHDKKIDRLSLGQYKADLKRDASSLQFVRATEGDRAFRFLEIINEILSYNNEGEIINILTGAGYDFPIEIYHKIQQFLENNFHYEQALRSHDPELRNNQDMIVERLAKIKVLIDSPRYRPLAYDFRYIPLARPGSSAYDKEIYDQIKLVDELVGSIFQLLHEISIYSSLRT
ncbi:HNH endonuclease signature motif containing protein [Pseudomonas sp. COR18]|uniref:HNH endonuclease signature motif containing protein n=1 Tax=Pseudomonas sp. COR18 TaxID=3399680 RepID=UPI003B0023A3